MITLGPNPATETLVIKGLKAASQISVYNPLGQIVYHEVVNEGESTYKTIPIKHLADGIYWLKINATENDTEVLTFIKHSP